VYPITIVIINCTIMTNTSRTTCSHVRIIHTVNIILLLPLLILLLLLIHQDATTLQRRIVL
jgi:hypothetical protein